VTAIAGPRRARILVVLVTCRARLGRVDPDERENSVVVECSAPVGRARFVTGFAGSREAGRAVVRAARAVVVCLVTAVAIPRSSAVGVVLVTGGARLCGVHTHKGEDAVVIEGTAPVGGACLVTGFAVRGVARRPVVRLVCLIVVCLVTAVAISGGPLVLVILVASGTGLCRVDADELENRGVIEACLLPVRVRELVT